MLKITDSMWEKYREDKSERSFEEIASEKLIERVQSLPVFNDKKWGGKNLKIEIASISFGFKNSKIINLLKLRGL